MMRQSFEAATRRPRPDRTGFASPVPFAHTFRMEDEVNIAPDGTVRHDSDLLPCARGGPQPAAAPEAMNAFFEGLNEAWPPSINVPVVRLTAGHLLVRPPRARFRRRTCFVCAHTLRVHDFVVICPCSPRAPLCEVAVHRDIVHGLYCLDAWNPGANRQAYCPITSRKLDE